MPTDDADNSPKIGASTPKISHHKHAAKTTDDHQLPQTRQNQEKGIYEFSIFIIAVLTGTGCSVISKIMYGQKGIGIDGQLEPFTKPLFQTLAMFFAMVLGVPMHWAVNYFQIPFPGYDHRSPRACDTERMIRDELTGLLPNSYHHHHHHHPCLIYGTLTDEESDHSYCADTDSENDHYDDDDEYADSNEPLPIRTYGILAILSFFDLAATALCTIGLLYLDVSVYQMLRGSCIIFVALLRNYALREPLYKFQWIGVFYNALSVVLVGAAAMMDDSDITDPDATKRSPEAFVGVLFMLAGTAVQALQFVLEEKIMVHDEIKVPPLLLFGMEGLWGFLMSVLLLLPAGYYLPGSDHGGRYENTFNTLVMLWQSPPLCVTTFFYMLSIFLYNLFAVLVTFSLSSLWHSILDNFRPLTVWMTDLFIFYVVMGGGGFGEPWTSYSWLELAGMCVLFYGTAIYNAPDMGSIQLKGQWYALSLNFQTEYSEIMSQRRGLHGSYPSLHRFLSSSLRTPNNSYNAGAQDLAKLISEAEQYCCDV
jgi:hypothetical protein